MTNVEGIQKVGVHETKNVLLYINVTTIVVVQNLVKFLFGNIRINRVRIVILNIRHGLWILTTYVEQKNIMSVIFLANLLPN